MRNYYFLLVLKPFSEPFRTSIWIVVPIWHFGLHQFLNYINRLRKILLYLLLFSYATVVVKPVLPLVGDAIAHTFWKLNHISTTHTENGKDHVHFELLETSKKTDDAKNNCKVEVFKTPHIVTQLTSYNFLLLSNATPDYQGYLMHLPVAFLQSNFLPPKA
jgi:hypothetical protein